MKFDVKNIQHSAVENTSPVDFFAFLKKDISFSKGIALKDLEYFYNQLSILMSAGLDLHAALQILEEGAAQRKKLCNTLLELQQALVNGKSLSDAIHTTSQFPIFDYYTIKIGEESGNFIQVFEDLSLFYQKKIANRRLIISSMTYPLIVMMVAFGAIFFMMNFLVPLFQDMFQQIGGELPEITQFVISISEGIQANTGFIFLGIVAIILLGKFINRMEGIQKNVHLLSIKIPLVKGIVKKIQLLRFLQLIYLLNKSHITILHSLDLLSSSIRFYPLNKAFKCMKQDLLKGGFIHEAMKKHSIFDAKIIAMVRVGEETNSLSTIYKRLVDQYATELEHENKILTTVLEPAIILILGFFVAFILIAMYLPIFNLSSGMGF